MRPAVTSDFYTVTELEFSATPSRLYGYDDFTTGYDFSRLTVDGAGVTLNRLGRQSDSGLLQRYQVRCGTDLRQ